jgi:hypothetical protein
MSAALRLSLGVLVLWSSALLAQEPEGSVADRVVAVVDDDPILASDMDRAVAFGLVRREPGEDEGAFEVRVLDLLIQERLRSHEIERHGFQEVPLSEVNQAYEDLVAGFPSQAEFERRLDELGLTEAAVKEILARQLLVLVFVEERLGPRVFVTLDNISDYYEGTLVPEMRRRGEPVPEPSAVREQIRTVLREQRLNREIELWTEELAFRADVIRYLEERPEELPPVVEIP